jgi:peroxiredoxin
MQTGRIIVYCLMVLLIGAALHPAAIKAEDQEFLDFSLKNVLDGTTYTLAEHRGKNMIVVFGSMYCKPCIELLPLLNTMHDESAALGITVIGVDIDATTEHEKLKKFVADHNIHCPFLVDSSSVAKRYKICMLPTIMLVDPSGRIEKKAVPGNRALDFLKKEYERLKAKAPQASK